MPFELLITINQINHNCFSWAYCHKNTYFPDVMELWLQLFDGITGCNLEVEIQGLDEIWTTLSTSFSCVVSVLTETSYQVRGPEDQQMHRCLSTAADTLEVFLYKGGGWEHQGLLVILIVAPVRLTTLNRWVLNGHLLNEAWAVTVN